MSPVKLAAPVGLLSAAVIGYELSLMRILLVASWHHFAFLVVSIALLGFGASGTLLALARRRLLARGPDALFRLTLATGILTPVAVSLAQRIPIEARFVPLLLYRQMAWWSLYWMLLSVPFLLGATAIGLAIILARPRIGSVYGANLLGSGAGAVAAPLSMFLVPPQWLPTVFGGLALLAAATTPGGSKRSRWTSLGILTLLLATALAIRPPTIRIDLQKDAAYVLRLVEQNQARLLASSFGPRGVVEAYRSDLFHDLPFASPYVAPPPIDRILLDGHSAGSVLRIARPDEAGVMDQTLMSVAYELAPAHPRVLLLGEQGGADIWLALRQGAQDVEAVQPVPAIYDLLRGPLRGPSGDVLMQPTVRATTADLRHHVEHSASRWDVVQLVGLQGTAAGSGGIGGLAQDHLVTVEGVGECLNRLEPRGILFACRGIQSPPRDNLKLLATFVAALRHQGVEQPESQLVILRDFLAVCTIARSSPWSPSEVDRLRELIAARQLTPVWFPGVRERELNQPDQLPGPPGAAYDWYHHAARQLFSDRAANFLDRWMFDINPPTDDRPFFFDYYKRGAVTRLREVFGDLWLTRAELAFLFVGFATGFIALLALLFTVLPLIALPDLRQRPGKTGTAIYFGAIGLAYLMLEMTVLSQLDLLIGEPLYAAAITIATFLVLSGLGSLIADRLSDVLSTRLPMLMVGLVALGIALVAGLGPLSREVGGLPLPGRTVIAILCISPPAFLMGLPMPTGLRRLRGAELISWAWGINGFASVLAAPLATLVAMSWGFRLAGVTALACYLVAALAFRLLPVSD